MQKFVFLFEININKNRPQNCQTSYEIIEELPLHGPEYLKHIVV